MADTVTITVLEDGPRYRQLKVAVHQDVANLAGSVLADPATGNFDPQGTNAGQFAIQHVQWSVPNPLVGQLFWEGAPNSVAVVMYDAQEADFDKFGAVQNDAVTKTGRLLLSTNGWVAAIDWTFTVTLKKC